MSEKREISEIEAQELLAQVLNNTPIPIVIAGETYQITALKLGVQNLIAEETCKIQKAQEGNMLDLYRQFAQSVPAVIRCLCYAVLNDKDRIFSDYHKRIYSEEYQTLYDQLEWESDSSRWIEILVKVMQRINIDFFFQAVSMLTMIKDSAVKTRKTTTERT